MKREQRQNRQEKQNSLIEDLKKKQVKSQQISYQVEEKISIYETDDFKPIKNEQWIRVQEDILRISPYRIPDKLLPVKYISCKKEQCLMPLCPSCVVEHTEEHYEAKQKPTYINLNDALSQVKNKCYEQVTELEQYYRVNEQIMNYIDGLKLYIRKQLAICKQTVFDHITVLFEEYESTLFRQITDKYQQEQVYNSQESNEVKNSILENIQSLYEKTSQLKADHCLSALIKYYGEDQEIIDSNISIIKQYLEKNKNAGGIHIGLGEDILVDLLKNMCDKVVSLKTITEKDLLEQATGKSKKGSDPGGKKPITIGARLRSPLGSKKTPNKAYDSPFKQKNFKMQREMRTSKQGNQFFNSGI